MLEAALEVDIAAAWEGVRRRVVAVAAVELDSVQEALPEIAVAVVEEPHIAAAVTEEFPGTGSVAWERSAWRTLVASGRMFGVKD